MDQLQRLKQVRSVAAVVGFDHGKMRETDFVAMPQVGAKEKLKRTLLGTAGAATFLYSASRRSLVRQPPRPVGSGCGRFAGIGPTIHRRDERPRDFAG